MPRDPALLHTPIACGLLTYSILYLFIMFAVYCLYPLERKLNKGQDYVLFTDVAQASSTV